MSFAMSSFLLVITLTSVLQSAQPAALTWNETCLYNWIVKSGVDPIHAIRFEWQLRQGSVDEPMIRQLSPYILGLMVGRNTELATKLKNCVEGTTPDCIGFNPCEEGGLCSFSAERKRNVCNCRHGLQGDLCEEDCDECSSECALGYSCHELATCVNTHGSYRCDCKEGFEGDGSHCQDIDECQLSLCSPDATCVNSIGLFNCVCKAGYTGNGSVCTEVCECCSNPCQNGGKCVEQVNGYMCKCPVGYDGSRCETRWLNRQVHKPLPMEVAAIEESLFNLTQEIAELRKIAISNAEDNCKLNPCQNGGRCIDQHHSFICICAHGFHGPNCSLLDRYLGLKQNDPASSCKHAFSVGQRNSGMYWIKPAQGEAVQVYCNMSAGGGWMRVVDIDSNNRPCPSNFTLVTSPRHVCTMTTSKSCKSAYFSSLGVAYSEVRGYAYGYQHESTNAFDTKTIKNANINQLYVDGISITRGNPRQHIWTFASGLSKDRNYTSNCPCAEHPGVAPQSFVGDDYYCESANNGYWESQWYSERLWDGHCYSKSSCCDRMGMPFFEKKLPENTADQLEVRICIDQAANSELVGLEKMELFIR